MLRYKTKTRPGLVALYDIRPGNGAGPFLQPRSPHGAGVAAAVYVSPEVYSLPVYQEFASLRPPLGGRTLLFLFKKQVVIRKNIIINANTNKY